jgi:hypothetical protein
MSFYEGNSLGFAIWSIANARARKRTKASSVCQVFAKWHPRVTAARYRKTDGAGAFSGYGFGSQDSMSLRAIASSFASIALRSARSSSLGITMFAICKAGV